MEKILFKYLFRLTMVGIIIISYKIVSPYTLNKWFPIKEIVVSGDYNYVEREQIYLVAENYLEGNFFTININLLREGMKKLPWIKDVDIYRQWPNRITMLALQHKPVARYGMQGLVSEDGVLFGAAYEDYLPYFNGPEEKISLINEKFNAFKEILSEEYIQIHKITLTRKNDWYIETGDGMIIKLNDTKSEENLKIFVSNFQNVLKTMNKRIGLVDLRYRDGFSVNSFKEPNRKIKHD